MSRLTEEDRDERSLVVKIIQKIRSEGTLRKTQGMYDLAKRGFFYIVENTEEEALNFANQMDALITVLNSNYGVNWDFDLELTRSYPRLQFNLHLIIRYPEIEITNSEEEYKHTIKDLFVDLQLRNSELVSPSVYSFHDPRGTRGTLSFNEWQRAYNHSHLNTDQINARRKCFYLDRFCLGGDTEIVQSILSLQLEFSEENYQMFFMTLDSLVSWESLEGVPFNYISEIEQTYSEEKFYYNESYEDYLVKELYLSEDLNCDFVYVNDRYKIKINERLSTWIREFILRFEVNKTREFLYTEVLGEKYAIPSQAYTIPPEVPTFETEEKEAPYVLLQGIKHTFTIEPYQDEIINLEDYKVYPKYVENAAKRIEQELYKKCIRDYTKRAFNTSING